MQKQLIPGTVEWIKSEIKKEGLKKHAANELDFARNGKIPAIEKAFSTVLEKKVAYMIATSHEYSKPNTEAAIKLVKNYRWAEQEIAINRLQGINKPVIQDKVDKIAKEIKKPSPLIAVNQFHGIRPQTPGKKILLDGHHRLKAYEQKNWTLIPIYSGEYTGKAELPLEELVNDSSVKK